VKAIIEEKSAKREGKLKKAREAAGQRMQLGPR